MKNGCRLELLGPVHVENKGQVVDGFISRKVVALLGYLTVAMRPVTRSYLAHLFWEDKSETRGRANLSRALSNLSKLLPNWVLADYHTVQFNAAAVDQIDIIQFKSLIDHGQISDLVRATLLYRGDFMAGINLADCPEFDGWLAGERERWQRQTVNTLRQLLNYYLDQTELEVAASFAAQLLRVEPWHEETHYKMMLILARTGQRSAALAQYELCKQALSEAFNVEPSAETVDLYNRIKAMAHKPHHNLPAQPTPFIGREAELATVAHQLSNQACRLLTIVGPGGMGKTRLAVQAAQKIAQYQFRTFLHGIYFIALAPIRSLDHLVSTVAETIDISLYGAANPLERLLSQLQNKEMLLVLDNFEHLLDGVELIQRILEQTPDIKILVTSRTRLSLRWEWLIEIQGLKYQITAEDNMSLTVGHHQAGQSKGLSALTLFEHVARRTKPGFSASNQNREIVTRICQLVEGLPLGIELAAVQVYDHACEEIAHGIERNLDFLTTSFPDIPPRHRSLRAIFDYSWEYLSDQEKKAFCRLSVFEGGFQQEAAEQVAGATRQTLTLLVDSSFLQRHNSGRYSFHQYLAHYGSERLKTSSQEFEHAKNQHCTYFAQYLRQREVQIGGQQKAWIYQLDLEIANIRAAWRWAVEQTKLNEIDQAIDGLFGYYELKGLFVTGVETFKWAAEQFAQIKATASGFQDQNSFYTTYGRILTVQSWFYVRLGLISNAEQLLERALLLLKPDTLQGQQDRSFAFCQLGLLNWYLGNYASGQKSLEAGLNLSRLAGNTWLTATNLHVLAMVVASTGQYSLAQEFCADALEKYEAIEEQRGVSIEHIYLGYLAMINEDYSKAKQLIQKGLAIGQAIEDPFSTGIGLTYLGVVTSLSEDLSAGKQLCLESMLNFDETSEQYGRSLSRNQLGRITWLADEFKASRRYFIEALEIALASPIVPQALTALAGLALHFDREGKKREALELTLYVINHAASEFETKKYAGDFLPYLVLHFSMQQVAEVEIKIKPIAIEIIGQQILAHESFI
ncbi:MAG: AAA family ATPase [Anaerolineae bacterium]|nr:AAA family ATPase [Anaerolineae bacterium]